MNRRMFFGTILGSAITSEFFDPERALWRPGKLISIPRSYTVADLIDEAQRQLGIVEPYTSGTQIAAVFREVDRLIDRWQDEAQRRYDVLRLAAEMAPFYAVEHSRHAAAIKRSIGA